MIDEDLINGILQAREMMDAAPIPMNGHRKLWIAAIDAFKCECGKINCDEDVANSVAVEVPV